MAKRSRRPCSSSMEMKINNNCLFNLLPVEIVVDIFSRLPVDSVSQCKRVCKTWRDHLIADHQYSNSIVEQGGFLLRLPHRIQNGFYYGEYDDKVPCFNLTRKTILNYQYPFENTSNWYIVGSCNGLICLGRKWNDDDMYVCNPYTGEYAQLPDSPRLNHVQAAAVDVAYGFGYHPITKEYKVIRIYYYQLHRPIHRRGIMTPSTLVHVHVQVYIVGSGSTSWRSIGEIKHKFCRNESPGNESGDNSLGILLDGVLYWLTETRELILSFDLADEKFRDIPTAPELSGLRCILGMLSGCLCVITNVSNRTHIWIMNMKDYSWSKKFDISRMEYDYTNYPIAHLESGKFLLHRSFMEFVSYEPETEHIVEIKRRMEGWPFDIIPYTKSFVSLKALGEKEAIQVKAEEEEEKVWLKISHVWGWRRRRRKRSRRRTKKRNKLV